jgi:hypothetical protein
MFTLNCLVMKMVLLSLVFFAVDGEGTAEATVEQLLKYDAAVAKCELSALQLGTEIADLFNAPIGQEDWNERIHQDKIIEKLGFTPWIANGISGTAGKTLQNNNAREIYDKSGWGSQSIDSSPYAPLNHKWIYMLGDSTTRQVWASFAAPFQGSNFERNAKEWTRHYCNGQPRRKKHGKNGHFDEEGWRGPCGANEVTCHVSGYGDLGVLSFDWKHFPYEDYDEWLWGPEGPWIAGFPGEGTRRPDVLTVQLGMHSCWHSLPEGLYSRHLTEPNETQIARHLEDITTLMKSIRKAVDFQLEVAADDKGYRPRTRVIAVTSGATGMEVSGATVDTCVLRFNRAVTAAAHAQGFAVLDRGEIEHRLMHGSVLAAHPVLKPDMHLPQPGQNIVATCLLDMVRCLGESVDPQLQVTAATLALRQAHNHAVGAARPLHSPP